MGSAGRNKEAARRWLSAVNERDLGVLLNCYSDDAIIHLDLPLMLGGAFRKEEVMEFAVAMWEVFPNGLKLTINEIVAEGDLVTVDAKSDGAHISGRRYQNWHQFVMVFRNGYIRELWSRKDTELARQVLFSGTA